MDRLRPAVDLRHIVLLVDDDQAVRESLKFTLEVVGFEVRAYDSAGQLLDDASIPRSSCLVTDYHMPGLNGLELVAKLRERHVSLPAVLVTALPSEDLRSRAAEAGIALLEKPLLDNRLVDSIQQAFVDYWKASP
jgi:FixJ family two-component response regulator